MRFLAALMLVAFATPPAWAAGVRTESPLDAYVLHRDGGRIAVAPVPGESPVSGWKTHVDPRTGLPTLSSGRGVEWFGAEETITLDALESKARAFLAERGWSVPMVRDDDAGGQLRKDQWKLVFRLEVDGVRVENARLDFIVHQGRLVLFGSSNWKTPALSGVPGVDATAARLILEDYLDGRTSGLVPDGEPELAMVAVDKGGLTHRLIWRIRYRDPAGPAEWVGEVDAHAGKVDAFFDDAHYAAVRGGVFPEQPDGVCGDGGCELDDFPMPFADWTEAGGSTVYTDSYGKLTCADPDATFATSLVGKYVEVVDTCGPIAETAGCDGSVQLGVKQGENCAVAPFDSPGNTAAARTSYYHVNRVAEVARFYNPSSVWLQQGQVQLHSNWPGTCNASYGGGGIYVYRESTSCANSGEIETVATHEWGHGYDDNDGGGYDYTSESYGDMVAMFASRQSCFSKGLFKNGSPCTGYGDTCLTCTGFRDHDWAARTLNTPATPQGFVQDYCEPGSGFQSPCGGRVHCESYPIDEAMWDLAVRDLPASGIDPDTAWQIAERLWFSSRVGSGGDIYNCSLPSSDSCGAGTWYQQLRVADDDDADLANGTPHAAAIFAAFDRHNIACGASTDSGNQSTSSCPAMTAPTLNLTTLPGGTDLSWTAVAGAAEYVVYRGDLGCRRQLVPVAVVSGATSWLDTIGDPDMSRSYRVQAVGSNPACYGPVSNCDAGQPAPRLQMNSHRLVEPGGSANGNGVLDPGETVEFPVTLFNGGSADAANVTGRLRVVDPAQGRVIEPLAGWGDIPVDTELESNAPHFAVTLFNDGIACGETLRLDLEMDADAAATRTKRLEFTLGAKNRDFPQTVNATLSRFSTAPILSTLDVADDTTIGELDVSVNISHTIPGDLIVELSSPMGTTVRLHDQTPGTGGIVTRYDLDTSPDGPGTMADFDGESPAGTWTLSVQNTVFGGGSGSFNDWTLHVTSAGAFGCSELICAEPTPTQAVDGLSVDKSAQDLLFGWLSAGAVFGYHVLQSSSPDYSGAVDLTGSTGTTALTVPAGGSGTNGVTYYQVRAVNACHQESP